MRQNRRRTEAPPLPRMHTRAPSDRNQHNSALHGLMPCEGTHLKLASIYLLRCTPPSTRLELKTVPHLPVPSFVQVQRKKKRVLCKRHPDTRSRRLEPIPATSRFARLARGSNWFELQRPHLDVELVVQSLLVSIRVALYISEERDAQDPSKRPIISVSLQANHVQQQPNLRRPRPCREYAIRHTAETNRFACDKLHACS